MGLHMFPSRSPLPPEVSFKNNFIYLLFLAVVGLHCCLLRWRVDSLPLSHKEALEVFITASAVAMYICVCVCVHSKGLDIFQNCIPMVVLRKD